MQKPSLICPKPQATTSQKTTCCKITLVFTQWPQARLLTNITFHIKGTNLFLFLFIAFYLLQRSPICTQDRHMYSQNTHTPSFNAESIFPMNKTNTNAKDIISPTPTFLNALLKSRNQNSVNRNSVPSRLCPKHHSPNGLVSLPRCCRRGLINLHRINQPIRLLKCLWIRPNIRSACARSGQFRALAS